MNPSLPYPLLSRLSEFVAAHTGLNFPPERWGDLERGIAAAAPDFNCPDKEACAHWLLSAPLTRRMNEVLASHLSVGETYFFREKQNLEIFEQHILPELLQSRRRSDRRLRIWSAGCSTGEEAYTIAIMLDRLIPDLKDWNVTILATDFNPKFLRKAMQGIYGEWSFRDAPAWLRERYFTGRPDDRLEILPRIRKMVTFSYLNFADDVYPSLSNNTSAMDVIFCRNVLMYFTAQRAKAVIGNFHRALLDGGWLIVSPAETSGTLFSPLSLSRFPGASLYCKRTDTETRADAPAPSGANAGWVPATQAWAAPEPLIAESPVPFTIRPDPAVIPAAPAAAIPAPAEDEAAHPAGHESPYQMARTCANQGKLGEALEWCEKSLAADKINPAHHYLQAAILQEQGQHDLATQSLRRALYVDPDFVLAHFALGNLHQSHGRYREARLYFGNVLLLLQRHPQDEVLPEAEGLTAGRLAEIVAALLESLPQAAAAVAG